MRVHVHKFHKFLTDYDSRLEKHYGTINPKISHQQHLQHINEWYSYDVQVDELGQEAYVEMSDENYTMFAIKYS